MFKRIVDRIIDNEVSKRRIEVEQRLRAEEGELRISYQQKLSELNSLNDKLNRQIQEVERVRLNAETEQKRLWERLDILKDNLNTEDVWLKLWECAYSKAVDVVWEIFKKETLRLIELAKENNQEEIEKKFQEQYEAKLQSLIKESSDIINVPLFLLKKEEANKGYLEANKRKDGAKEQFFLGQLKLIEEIKKNDSS